VIGLACLLFILLTTQIEESRLIDLQHKDIGDVVRVSGIVERHSINKNTTIITISQTLKIKGVIFDEVNLSKGNTIEVIGKLAEYNGEKELIIEKIICC